MAGDKPRPIHPRIVKRINNYRITELGALTPRLRQQESLVGAIGFHHDFQEQQDEDRDRGRDFRQSRRKP